MTRSSGPNLGAAEAAAVTRRCTRPCLNPSTVHTLLASLKIWLDLVSRKLRAPLSIRGAEIHRSLCGVFFCDELYFWSCDRYTDLRPHRGQKLRCIWTCVVSTTVMGSKEFLHDTFIYLIASLRSADYYWNNSCIITDIIRWDLTSLSPGR